MADILCPECSKTKYKFISSYAKECPTCGFPMADFLKEHGLNDFNKVWICTKCGECYDTNDFKQPICEYCDCPLIQTDITNKDNQKINGEEYYLNSIELAKKYGNDFSEESYSRRRERIRKRINKFLSSSSDNSAPQPNVPHCPTCGSTNIKKISATSKAVGAGLFGLFSKTARSQFECKDCGYKW